MRLSAADVVALATPYFQMTGDRQSRIVVFSSNRPPMDPRGAFRFGPPDRGLTVFEQFGGRRPFVFDHEFLIERGTSTVVVRPTILLGSQVIGLLGRYLRPPIEGAAPNADRDADRAAAHEFLRFAVEKNFDYNPVFYVLETVVKTTDREVARDFARQGLATLLTLHAMDEARFLAGGGVVTDRATLARYEDEYGVRGIDAIAERRAARLLDTFDPAPFVAAERPTYAALLRIALLRHEPGDVAQRLRTFREFVTQRIGMQMAREEVLAALVCAGAETPLDNLERSSVYEKFLGRVRAAVWDLLLLRAPEALLAVESSYEVELAYICTNDGGLAAVGQPCVVDVVASGGVTRVLPPSMLSFDRRELGHLIGREAADALEAGPSQLAADLVARVRRRGTAAPTQDLEATIAELEHEILRFVGRS